MDKIQIDENLYDIDIERSILSSIIYNNDNLGLVDDVISANDFYLEAHSNIYLAMLECMNKDEPINAPFLKKYLPPQNIVALDEVIGINAIVGIRKFAIELREKSIKRSIVKIAYNIPNKISEDKKARDIVDEISSDIYSLIEGNHFGSIKNSKEIMSEVLSEFEKQQEIRNKFPDHSIIGLDTGFRKLNQDTKGFKDGDLIIIAARPGMGKTAFAINLIDHVLKTHGVVLFSLEMPAHQIMLRMLSIKTSIPLSKLFMADMNDEEIEHFSHACDDIAKKKFFVHDGGNVSIHQIRTQMRRLKTIHPEINLCVIDYIGLMANSSSYSDRHLQIAEISRGLKLLARELNMPIIALSQLNRSLENRANKRPMLSDLRESGAIEQDADTILFVYRNDVYLEQEEKEKAQKAKADGREITISTEFNKVEEEAEIIIGKNRNGPTGTVKLIFQKEYTRFVDNSFGYNLPQEITYNE